MAKAQYAVVDGTTRKIKKKYAAIDGKTRKIKKEYAVIDGKTRLIWSGLADKVYLADGGRNLYYSDDLNTWTINQTFEQWEVRKLLYANNKYYLLVEYANYFRVYSSEDAQTWTKLCEKQSPFSSAPIDTFKYLNGKFFMFADSIQVGNYSTDCITWTSFTYNNNYLYATNFTYIGGAICDLEYGTVNNVTAYYGISHSTSQSADYSGCALFRYNSFEDLISGNVELVAYKHPISLSTQSDAFSYVNALIIKDNVAYVPFTYYTSDRWYYYIYKSKSSATPTYFNTVTSSTSYMLINIWSAEDKIIFDRAKKIDGSLTYTTKGVYNYSAGSIEYLSTPSYSIHYDLSKGVCHDNTLVGIDSTEIYYSLDGGTTFTIVTTPSTNSSNGEIIYGIEGGGFYSER